MLSDTPINLNELQPIQQLFIETRVPAEPIIIVPESVILPPGS